MASVLTSTSVFQAFAEQIRSHDGRVSESCNDGRSLFARAVLAREAEVARADRVQAGVALRMTAGQIDVHPYLYRLVCRNGQIFVEAAETRRIEVSAWSEPETILTEIRRTVDACCGADAFATSARAMREARADQHVELMIMLMPMIHSLAHQPAVVRQLMEQFARREEDSRFGLINAVTATARTVRDAEVKWRLESFGGELALLRPPEPVDPRSAARRVVPV